MCNDDIFHNVIMFESFSCISLLTNVISWYGNVLTKPEIRPKHLLSIECADWPRLHGVFKARDTIVWQREFPVGFPVEVSALNSLLIKIFHDVVVRIDSRCVIKANMPCWSVNSFDCALEKLHSCWSARFFSRAKSNELSDQQDMFFYRHASRQYRNRALMKINMLSRPTSQLGCFFRSYFNIVRGPMWIMHERCCRCTCDSY